MASLAELEAALGVKILPFKMHRGDSYAYANPGEDSIDLSLLFLREVVNLRRRARHHIPINRNQALAAFAACHELGHLNSPDHRSEDQANAWAARNYRYVLQRLGLNKRQRNRCYWLAQGQGLL